jgi:hypothetical protein
MRPHSTPQFPLISKVLPPISAWYGDCNLNNRTGSHCAKLNWISSPETTALLKITSLYPDEGHCLLRLEGQLADIWIEELQRQCAQELAHPRQLTLQMSGVQYLDQRAKNFIWELIGKDVAIEGCSPFVSEQLRPWT